MTSSIIENITLRTLFDNRIVLRDLTPKDTSLPGLRDLALKLGVDDGTLPRKNEFLYAMVLEEIVHAMTGGQVRNVCYIGDTIFTDGNVIRNLAQSGRFDVLGFICNESPGEEIGDFLFHDIIFSDRWSHVTRMVPVGRSRGFDFGPSTVAVFDLDQTIYAAKGRNNNPLRRARYQAVSELLVEVLGRERVNDLVVSRRYGEFDQEKYHVVTGDNQDYVVFLAVACYMNLYEPEDILEELAKPHVTMLDIIASVLSRLEIRRGREDIDELCRMIGDVLVDARVGDPTPFKKFRYKEFTKTSDAMIIPASVQTDENPDYSERVYLTREMVEFIYFLKSRGCGVIAFSDRPIEATEPMERGEKLSLLDIPMSIAGPSIERDLESLDP